MTESSRATYGETPGIVTIGDHKMFLHEAMKLVELGVISKVELRQAIGLMGTIIR